MTVSGTHCVDMWKYLKRTHLTVRSNCVVPGVPVFYYGLLAKDHPGIEGSWNYTLDESLQSNSTTIPGDTADCKSTSSITTSTNKPKDDILFEAIQKTNSLLDSNGTSDRQQLVLAQTKVAENNLCREMWEEYDRWCDTVSKLKEERGCEKRLRNIARRVRKLEVALDIPLDSSIVEEFV